MNANVNTTTSTIAVVTAIDGFDVAAQDPSASPIRGVNVKFKDGDYFSFADKIDVRERTFVVLDRKEGWQFLKKDCPPEYLMRAPNGPRPPQPHVDEAAWPLNLNGKPEHPWKLTRYLYLLDAATGEISTFWTSTIGGRIGIDELTDQMHIHAADATWRAPGCAVAFEAYAHLVRWDQTATVFPSRRLEAS